MGSAPRNVLGVHGRPSLMPAVPGSAVQPVLVLLLQPPVGFVFCHELVVTAPTACCTQPSMVTGV